MSDWNAFDGAESAELEEKLGEPILTGKLCDCGHVFSNHDEIGCASRGCDCSIKLNTLIVMDKRNDRK